MSEGPGHPSLAATARRPCAGACFHSCSRRVPGLRLHSPTEAACTAPSDPCARLAAPAAGRGICCWGPIRRRCLTPSSFALGLAAESWLTNRPSPHQPPSDSAEGWEGKGTAARPLLGWGQASPVPVPAHGVTFRQATAVCSCECIPTPAPSHTSPPLPSSKFTAGRNGGRVC